MGVWETRPPYQRNMKKNRIIIGLSSLLLALSLASCGTNPENPGDNPSGGGEEQETSQLINATIDRQILDMENNDSAKITCSLAGVSYRSSDERVVSVDTRGKIYAEGYGNAFVTVSKAGHFDKVFKVFVDQDNSLDYLVEGFEFGPAITGVKISLPGEVTSQDLQGASFAVKTNRGNRTVGSVSLCDIEGQVINATKSKYVRINLNTSYNGYSVENAAACFSYANNMNSWKTDITAEVTFNSALTYEGGSVAAGTKISAIRTRTSLSTKDWGEAKSFTSDGQTLTYKAYEVDALREDGVKNPLVIWLHGMGEGGTDPDIALLGNDVTALGETTIQSHFVKGEQKGAYVLAVQTPTMWMNNGTGGQSGGGNSIYRAALKSTIDHFIAENLDIDTNRIYLGGCSNGGYMTMEMAINYGNFFRAYYPCCEAYADRLVTDIQINALKDLSIWYIHAANDSTVNPQSYTIDTYQRLIRAGATDVHLSYFVDVRGTDCNPRGNNYMGHFSWIYIFRDEVALDQADPEHVSAPSTAEVKVNNQVVNLFDWMESKK